MALYSLGTLTTSTTAGSAVAEIIPGASDEYSLMQFEIVLTQNTVSQFRFGRPVIGVTPTAPVNVLAEDGNNTAIGQTTVAVAWGTAPTTPWTQTRRVSFSGVIGQGIIWTWPRGFKVLPSTSSGVGNIAGIASSLINLTCVVDE